MTRDISTQETRKMPHRILDLSITEDNSAETYVHSVKGLWQVDIHVSTRANILASVYTCTHCKHSHVATYIHVSMCKHVRANMYVHICMYTCRNHPFTYAACASVYIIPKDPQRFPASTAGEPAHVGCVHLSSSGEAAHARGVGCRVWGLEFMA